MSQFSRVNIDTNGLTLLSRENEAAALRCRKISYSITWLDSTF